MVTEARHGGDGALHMLQGWLQYVEELISWTKDETDIDDDLGG